MSRNNIGHSLREAAKFATAVAALFLLAGFYCMHWAHSRGAFGVAPVNHPVNLKRGSTIDVHFSVPNKGDQDVELWYARNEACDVGERLDGIVGRATLRISDAVTGQIPLPTFSRVCDRDGCAMVLFTGPMEPRNDYSLRLQVDRIPQSLAEAQAVVKVKLAADYVFLFSQVMLAVVLLLLGTLLCALLSVRWWRAASRGN